MNFSQLFHKSNSSINIIEGTVRLKASVIQTRGDLVLIDAGLTNSALCFQNELSASRPTSLSFSDESESTRNCIIGIEKIESSYGQPILVFPTVLQKYSRRKLVWAALSKVWFTGKHNRIKGFILNSVKGGYAVAIAGHIAFLPRSLCVNKRVYLGQWKVFSILNMNQKIGNIVVREYVSRTNRKALTTKFRNYKTKRVPRILREPVDTSTTRFSFV